MLAETRIGRALFNAIRNLARELRPGASFSCLKNTHDNIPDGRNASLLEAGEMQHCSVTLSMKP